MTDRFAATPDTAVIDVNDVAIRYGRRTAVEGLRFAVPRGIVYGLLGRNGAGKSSLVRCILGEQRAAYGSARLFGEDSWVHRARLMDRVGVVAEDGDAPPQMRVGAIGRFHARLYSRWNQTAFESRLQRFSIRQDAKFGSLSKGEKKQVALALALATTPELLILDDPTLGLDVVARRSLFEEVIAELADRGITILLTTHDLTGVESIADRVGILAGGRLVVEEDLESLKSRFRRIRTAAQPAKVRESGLSTAAVRSWGSGSEAVVTNFDDRAFERFRTAEDAVETSAMSLEEIFVAICGEEGARS